MKICVTGANGFLANNIIRELIAREHEIVAFIKTGEDISTINDLKIELRYGDILDYKSILPAVEGCDALIHAAADTSTYPSISESQYRVNVEGTVNVMNAALEKRLTRVLHIGSANSFGFGTKENPGNENSPYSCARYKLGYIDSKRDAQHKVLEMVRTRNLPALVLNPAFMLGRFCVASGSGQMLIAVRNRKTPGYSKGGRNFVYVKDVAVAVANALTMGQIGECYILGNENLSYKEIFSKMAEGTGVSAPKLCIPGFAAMAFGFILEVAGRLFSFKPALTYRMAMVSCDGNYYSSEKAIRDLKLPQTPIEIAIKEADEWLSLKK
ncbi:MAG: NAD-dependent epimerase/dehydratase family protein [Bacteroidota bacterium]